MLGTSHILRNTIIVILAALAFAGAVSAQSGEFMLKTQIFAASDIPSYGAVHSFEKDSLLPSNAIADCGDFGEQGAYLALSENSNYWRLPAKGLSDGELLECAVTFSDTANSSMHLFSGDIFRHKPVNQRWGSSGARWTVTAKDVVFDSEITGNILYVAGFQNTVSTKWEVRAYDRLSGDPENSIRLRVRERSSVGSNTAYNSPYVSVNTNSAPMDVSISRGSNGRLALRVRNTSGNYTTVTVSNSYNTTELFYFYFGGGYSFSSVFIDYGANDYGYLFDSARLSLDSMLAGRVQPITDLSLIGESGTGLTGSYIDVILQKDDNAYLSFGSITIATSPLVTVSDDVQGLTGSDVEGAVELEIPDIAPLTTEWRGIFKLIFIDIMHSDQTSNTDVPIFVMALFLLLIGSVGVWVVVIKFSGSTTAANVGGLATTAILMLQTPVPFPVVILSVIGVGSIIMLKVRV